MKKHIIIYIILFSSFLHAEESLEERKKRIMRKYLREQVIIFNSDLIVENISNKEAIKDSEKMKIDEQDFLKHEGSVERRIVSPRITRRMYEQWNLDDKSIDINNEKKSPLLSEYDDYEYKVNEKDESDASSYRAGMVYSTKNKNSDLLLPYNNFINQDNIYNKREEKRSPSYLMPSNINNNTKYFNPYSSFGDESDQFDYNNKSILDNRVKRVDPAQPNTNFDEFKDMYKIK